MTQEDKGILEAMVDKHGMASVLEGLSCVCHEKAGHVLSNYDDRIMASAWRRGAARVDKAQAYQDWPL